MDLYKQMRNIRGKSNREELEKCIKIVRARFKDLTEQRTCKIYNGELYKDLISNHIPAKLMNTKDLDMNYEHVYVMVLDDTDGYLVADLTFSQFENDDEKFSDLKDNGYMKMDEELYADYLDILSNSNLYGTITNLVNENNKKR